MEKTLVKVSIELGKGIDVRARRIIRAGERTITVRGRDTYNDRSGTVCRTEYSIQREKLNRITVRMAGGMQGSYMFTTSRDKAPEKDSEEMKSILSAIAGAMEQRIEAMQKELEKLMEENA